MLFQCSSHEKNIGWLDPFPCATTCFDCLNGQNMVVSFAKAQMDPSRGCWRCFRLLVFSTLTWGNCTCPWMKLGVSTKFYSDVQRCPMSTGGTWRRGRPWWLELSRSSPLGKWMGRAQPWGSLWFPSRFHKYDGSLVTEARSQLGIYGMYP